MNADERRPFGQTGFQIPKVVFGTSSLGNLYKAVSPEDKAGIIQGWFDHSACPVFVDTACKYGAGLALETMGQEFGRLGIDPEDVVVLDKLGWRRIPLSGLEPNFEPGAWIDLENDAVQDISAEGILRCWEEDLALLGDYQPQFVSVHDPDEYLAAANSPEDRAKRWDDILGAYGALESLRRDGVVDGVGVGSKDWKVIRELAEVCSLDWVMIANSLTILHHPPELLSFVESLASDGVGIINSAVFHAGFLVGANNIDYRAICEQRDAEIIRWREQFVATCREFSVTPAEASVAFAMTPPGVDAIALSSSNPNRIASNVDLAHADIPTEFWTAMVKNGLIDTSYPYLS